MIKVSVVATLLLCIAQIVSGGFALGANAASVILVQCSLNFLLSTFFGIFILKDDEGRMCRCAYRFVESTCCSTCAQSCGGGVACLMPFIVWNACNIIFSFLPLNGSPLWLALAIYQNLNSAEIQNKIGAWICIVSCLAILLSQIFGTFAAWKAYKICREDVENIGAIGGGYPNGGGFNGGGASPAAPQEEAPQQQSQQQPQGFRPFEGQGQRLGV